MKSNSRFTVDLANPQLMTLLKIEATRKNIPMREVIITALESYFYSSQENQAILKLAEKTFAEWENPLDAAYDNL